MKSYLLTLIAFVLAFLSLNISKCDAQQNNFEPTMIILTPFETKEVEELREEINEGNALLDSNRQENIKIIESQIQYIDSDQENIKMSYQKQIEFAQTATYYSTFSLMGERFLQYFLYSNFPNMLIYTVPRKSNGIITDLEKLADSLKVRYVLNFPMIDSYLENDKPVSKIRVQLYDYNQKKVILDNIYTGNSVNHGFEFTCDEGTLDCTFINALNPALKNIIDLIISNSSSIKDKENLKNLRLEILSNFISNIEIDPNIVNIVNRKDSTTLADKCIFTLSDPTNTNFISCFMEPLSNNSSERTDAYFVFGSKYNSEWYIKNPGGLHYPVTSLERAIKYISTELIQLDYFKPKTTDFNPDFWSTNYFNIVKSIVEREKDKINEIENKIKNSNDSLRISMLKSQIEDKYEEDAKNKKYFGISEIAVDGLQEKEKIENQKFENWLYENGFKDYFKNLVDNSNSISEVETISYDDFTYIYPSKHDKAILCADIITKDERSQLMYYVALKNGDEVEIYEWNYFKNDKTKKGRYLSSVIVDQISSLTFWNYSFMYLDDEEFWNKYVLAKKGDKYLYLQN